VRSTASADAAVPAASADLLLASIALMVGSCFAGRALFLLGVPVTAVGFVLVARIVWIRTPRPTVNWHRHAGRALFLLVCMGVFAPPLPAPLWLDVVSRAYFAGGAIVVALAIGPNASRRRRGVTALIVVAAAISALVVVVVRDPPVDLWILTNEVTRRFLQGVQPYTIPAASLYTTANSNAFSAPVYPYMPATLLVFAPAVALLGDYRFLLAACMLAVVPLLRAASRVRGLDERFIDFLTLAVLLHPRIFWFPLAGWTEPAMAFVAAVAVYWAVRGDEDTLAAVAWFFLSALKQYVLTPPLIYALMTKPRPRPRAIAVALGVSAATAIPFVLWAWRPTLRGILFQFYEVQHPRQDATSLVSFGMMLFGKTMARWWSVAAQLVVTAVAYWRRGRDGRVVLVSAAALYATFLFGWQAFFNYYYFVAVLLLLAAVAETTKIDVG
jgi:hypothetical protein